MADRRKKEDAQNAMGQERLSVLLRNNLASNVTGAVQYAEAVER